MSAEPEIRKLSQALFGMAKTASTLAFTCEAAALVLGARFAMMRAPEWTSTSALVALAFATFFLRGLAGGWTEQANEQLRQLDLADGLGRPISQRARADFLAQTSVLAGWLARWRQGDAAYFASPQAGSPLRLVENLRESAWWTSHLAATAASLQKIWLFLFGTLAVGTLAMGAMRAGTASMYLATPSFAIAVLLFLFTNGPYRRLGEFRDWQLAAERVERDAGNLLDRGVPISEADALVLASEYHLARKGAPLVPGFVWRLRRGRLNPLWDGVAQDRPRPVEA